MPGLGHLTREDTRWTGLPTERPSGVSEAVRTFRRSCAEGRRTYRQRCIEHDAERAAERQQYRHPTQPEGPRDEA